MRTRMLFVILISAISCFAQTIHLPDYFPLHHGGRWIYLDEFGNFDTATMALNVPFAGELSIAFSLSSSEKQFFKADTNGLSMLGQTIPLGTFSFDAPLGIVGLDATIGDGAVNYNLNVVYIPSRNQLRWGDAQVVFSRIETNKVVLDSVYDSVLVIDVNYGTSSCQYFLAKNVGIVKSTARGSPSFIHRELVKFIPASAGVAENRWPSGGKTRTVNVLSYSRGKLASFSMPLYGNNIHVSVISLDGRKIAERSFKNEHISVLKMQENCPVGKYILRVRDGSKWFSRTFVILP